MTKKNFAAEKPYTITLIQSTDKIEIADAILSLTQSQEPERGLLGLGYHSWGFTLYSFF